MTSDWRLEVLPRSSSMISAASMSFAVFLDLNFLVYVVSHIPIVVLSPRRLPVCTCLGQFDQERIKNIEDTCREAMVKVDHMQSQKVLLQSRGNTTSSRTQLLIYLVQLIFKKSCCLPHVSCHEQATEATDGQDDLTRLKQEARPASRV
eukprot:2777793-Amphidinium_carterae.2